VEMASRADPQPKLGIVSAFQTAKMAQIRAKPMQTANTSTAPAAETAYVLDHQHPCPPTPGPMRPLTLGQSTTSVPAAEVIAIAELHQQREALLEHPRS
jgi:hypothetical protein